MPSRIATRDQPWVKEGDGASEGGGWGLCGTSEGSLRDHLSRHATGKVTPPQCPIVFICMAKGRGEAPPSGSCPLGTFMMLGFATFHLKSSLR